MEFAVEIELKQFMIAREFGSAQTQKIFFCLEYNKHLSFLCQPE